MSEPILVNIAEWVEKARSDPLRYLERQATELVLNAIGMAPFLKKTIFLKGGALMGVVYNSPRQTADLDFTTSLEPERDIDTKISDALDSHLSPAAAKLGYPDLVARVQSIAKRPKAEVFPNANFPALRIKIGYARRGSRQEQLLEKGQCSEVIELDLSFNEPVDAIQVVQLGDHGAQIEAYSLIDLVAEKLRALLQQVDRNRYRRQDVYDIALLLKHFPFDEEERTHIRDVFLEKCSSRNIEPSPDSLSNSEVVRRAQSDWDTLKLEIDEVPPFEECFSIVHDFYLSLPWKVTEIKVS